ncbi:MAG: ribonuclease P protein component [Pseudomonadota bacterium]
MTGAFSTLKKRRDFLAAARARRWAAPGFVLQARRRKPDEPSDAPIRIGYTASKKVGNAVARNRAKRRLRALAAELAPSAGEPGFDYVLIARADATTSLPFATLRQQMAQAFERVHAERRQPPDGRKPNKPKAAGAKAPRPETAETLR